MTTLVMINVFGKTLAEALPISIWLHTGILLSAAIYFRKDLQEIQGNLPSFYKIARKFNFDEFCIICGTITLFAYFI